MKRIHKQILTVILVMMIVIVICQHMYKSRAAVRAVPTDLDTVHHAARKTLKRYRLDCRAANEKNHLGANICDKFTDVVDSLAHSDSKIDAKSDENLNQLGDLLCKDDRKCRIAWFTAYTANKRFYKARSGAQASQAKPLAKPLAKGKKHMALSSKQRPKQSAREWKLWGKSEWF